MSPKPCYCINPNCKQPDHPQNNNPNTRYCLSCGSELLLNCKFRVSRLLSDDSGFGNVYEAFQGFSACILKVLKPQWNSQPTVIKLFKQEYEVLAQLTKQGITAIPQALDFFEYQTRDGLKLYCLVMEKVEGIDLEQWVNIHGKINQKQALKWLKEIVIILDKIHNTNYFHRDIKPAHIMMRNNGELVLIDFGTAREETQSYYQQLQGQRVTGIVSVGYTPIEQQNGQAVKQSDFFALGRTFVHLLTGKHPIDLYDNYNDELVWQEETENINLLFLDLIELLMKRVKDRPENSQVILEKLTGIESNLSNSINTFKSQKTPVLQKVVSSPPQPLAIPNFTLLHSLQGHTYWKIESKWFGFKEEKTLVKCAVNSLAFSPDGNYLASGGDDKNIRLWDVSKGKQICYFSGHISNIITVDFSPNGQFLASASDGESIKIWDINTGKFASTFRGHSNSIRSINFSPDSEYLASGSYDQTIKIWHIKTGQLLYDIKGHSSFVRCVNFSPDGNLLASGSSDKTIKIWDVNNGQELLTINSNLPFISSVSFSPDSKILASSSNGIIKIWDVTTGKEINTFSSGNFHSILSLAFHPDGQILVSGGHDHTIKIWEVATRKEINILSGHSQSINSVKFSPCGRYLASGSDDGTIKIWKVEA